MADQAEEIIASPESRGPRTDRVRIALAAVGGGLAVVLIGAGAVAVSGMASADTSAAPTPSIPGGPAATESSGPPPVPGGGPMAGGFGGFGGFGGLGGLGALGALGRLGDPLHGSALVKGEDGSFVTYEAQRGVVTAVSASSISVRSDDGYEHTYVVTKDTVVNRDGSIEDITKGSNVLVIATLDGATSNATRIVDLTELQQRLDEMRQRWADRAGQGPPTQGPWHRFDRNEAPGGGATGPWGESSPAPIPSESATA